MENMKIFEMADRLKTLQERKKDLEAQTKALVAEIADLDEQLSDAMTEAELDRFSRNGSTFYLKSRLFASPAAGRKDEMMQALKENGYASLVVETVNAVLRLPGGFFQLQGTQFFYQARVFSRAAFLRS